MLMHITVTDNFVTDPSPVLCVCAYMCVYRQDVSNKEESDGERCVWDETASVFPVYLPCVWTQSQWDRPYKRPGYCRAKTKNTDEWPHCELAEDILELRHQQRKLPSPNCKRFSTNTAAIRSSNVLDKTEWAYYNSYCGNMHLLRLWVWT